MNNKRLKKIVFALECIIFLAVLILIGFSNKQAEILNVRISNIQSDISTVQEQIENHESKKAAADTAALKDGRQTSAGPDTEKEPEAAKSEPSPVVTPIPTETPTPTETPIPTETPTPTPEPMYLMDLSGYYPGAVIDDSLIDTEFLWNYFTSSEIYEGDEIFNRIFGRSFVYNDNIQLSDLRYIKLIHRNFYDETQVGEIIVNAAIEEDILDIFMQLYVNGYQIRSMYLIDEFWAGDGDSSDFASIEEDNTSAFCYRTVTGSSSNLSNHAYGLAIDLNPLENPYVLIDDSGYGSSGHAGSQAYIYDRSSETMPHVIDYNDLAYQLFTEHGFTWGGDWSSPKDYQHFQKELY